MFAAAMIYSTPALELSIYSTCKRISQKLMRNVTKFLSLIYAELPNSSVMPVLRCNMEEVILQGPEGAQDVRIVNSYPSQVMVLFNNVYTHASIRLYIHARSIFSPTVLQLFPKRSSVLLACWNFSIRYASVSTCRASRASPSHLMFGLQS